MATPFPFTYMDNAACASALVPWGELAGRVGRAMADYSSGAADMPVRATLRVPEHAGVAGLMPCYSPDGGLVVKLLYWLADNRTKHGLPTLAVYVIVFDPVTGGVSALMQGDAITEMRTAAASALAARLLLGAGREEVRTLAVLGAGRQAASHLQALAAQHPRLAAVNVWNRTAANAASLVQQVAGWMPGAAVRVHPTVPACVGASGGADVIVTATFADEPILKKSHLQGLGKAPLVLAVGAASPELSEMDGELMRSAAVVVDSYAGAREESGDVVKSKCQLDAELGELVSGVKKLTHEGSRTTVFKSLGLAVQDMAAAQMVASKTTGAVAAPSGFPAPFWDAAAVRSALDKAGRSVASAPQVCSAGTSVRAGSGGPLLRVSASNLADRYLLFRASVTGDSGGLCLALCAKTGALLGAADSSLAAEDDVGGDKQRLGRLEQALELLLEVAR